MALWDAAAAQHFYQRADTAERVQDQIAVLIRSNTDFKGALLDRVRQLVGAHGVIAAVMETLKSRHPYLRPEIAAEHRRAAFWFGADRLAEDVQESETEADSEQEG